MLEIILAIFASTGFWAFVTTMIQRHDTSKNARDKIILGLAHDRICELAKEYILEGEVSQSDYESLHDYLYAPYKELGGNGTAEKLMNEVKGLPTKK